jgi:LCP family protein required for cell wall assembly
MAENGEQQGADQPDYKVYRSKRGLLSRFRSPDLSGLRERAKLGRRDGDKEGRKPPAKVAAPGEERPLGKRILRWALILAAGWILLSVVAFAISAQLQSWKLADDADSVLGGNPLLIASPQNILVVGTDARTADSSEPGAETRQRCLDQQAAGEAPHDGCPGFRADTLMVVRGGGGKFRKLSIPRDVFTEIEGIGASKINAAYAFGGAKGQVRAVEDLLGIDIDHVVIIDFEGFQDLIDAIGGVEVTVEKKFCSEISGGAGGGQGGFSLRLGKGEHTLDGEDALTFARTRTNECDAGYDDLDRAAAQQQVLNGIKGRMTSPLRLPYNFIKGPIIAWSAPKAFVSDMGALTMPQLVLSTAVASSGDTDVLCQGQNSGCGPGPFGSIEVPQSERNRAVKALTE